MGRWSLAVLVGSAALEFGTGPGMKCGFSAGASMAIYWDIVDITGYRCFL